GEAIAEAESSGRWSRELLQAAAAAGVDPAKAPDQQMKLNPKAAFYLIEYRDGLKGAGVITSGWTKEFAFACLQKKGDIAANCVRLDDGLTSLHFAYLVKAIEFTVHTGLPAYPVERTLLTTGVLDALMHSLADKGKRIETPHLAIRYQPVEWPYA